MAEHHWDRRLGPRGVLVAVVATVGLLAAIGCTAATDDAVPSPSSTEQPDAAPSPPASPSSTEPETRTFPDNPVGRFAEAVENATTSPAAIGGSPAAHYLEYFSLITELTGIPAGTITEVDEDRIVLAQGMGRMDVVYDDFVQTELGISELALNGRQMVDTVAVIPRPIRHPSGVEVLSGYDFTSYGPSRIVVVEIENNTGTPISVSPLKASFIDEGGIRSDAVEDGLGSTVELAPGASSLVINTFPRGEGDPAGILQQVVDVLGQTGASGPGPTVVVPFGDSQPTFFAFGSDGTLRGQLDADIAFATDSAEPSTDALDILFKASQELLSYDGTSLLCVAGHADSVGAEARNLELSEARAEAVAAVLVGYGVTNPIRAEGYGESLAPGSELDDPASRRVDVSVSDCP